MASGKNDQGQGLADQEYQRRIDCAAICAAEVERMKKELCKKKKKKGKKKKKKSKGKKGKGEDATVPGTEPGQQNFLGGGGPWAQNVGYNNSQGGAGVDPSQSGSTLWGGGGGGPNGAGPSSQVGGAKDAQSSNQFDDGGFGSQNNGGANVSQNWSGPNAQSGNGPNGWSPDGAQNGVGQQGGSGPNGFDGQKSWVQGGNEGGSSPGWNKNGENGGWGGGQSLWEEGDNQRGETGAPGQFGNGEENEISTQTWPPGGAEHKWAQTESNPGEYEKSGNWEEGADRDEDDEGGSSEDEDDDGEGEGSGGESEGEAPKKRSRGRNRGPKKGKNTKGRGEGAGGQQSEGTNTAAEGGGNAEGANYQGGLKSQYRGSGLFQKDEGPNSSNPSKSGRVGEPGNIPSWKKKPYVPLKYDQIKLEPGDCAIKKLEELPFTHPFKYAYPPQYRFHESRLRRFQEQCKKDPNTAMYGTCQVPLLRPKIPTSITGPFPPKPLRCKPNNGNPYGNSASGGGNREFHPQSYKLLGTCCLRPLDDIVNPYAKKAKAESSPSDQEC